MSPNPSHHASKRRPSQAPLVHRNRLRLGLTIALVGLLGCDIAQRGEPEIRVYGEVEPEPIEVSLDRIEDWLQRRAQPYADALQPGVDREHVDRAIEGLGIRLPEEVYRLYAWRNGQREGDDESVQFFPGYRFLPIEEAAELTRMTRDILWAMPVIGRWSWSKRYVPIFELQEDFYVVVAKGGEVNEVLDWSLEGGPIVSHRSLAATVQEIADTYDANGYVMTDAGLLISDEEREVEVLVRYHPALDSRRGLDSEVVTAVDERQIPGGQRMAVWQRLGGTFSQFRVYDRHGALAAAFYGDRDATEYDPEGRPLVRDDITRGSVLVDLAWTWHDAEHATLTRTVRYSPPFTGSEPPETRHMHRDADGVWSWLRAPAAGDAPTASTTDAP